MMKKGLAKIILFQVIFVVLFAGMLYLFTREKKPDDVSLDKIEAGFVSEFDMSGLEKAGSMRVKQIFGINTADYTEYICYTSNDTMDVEELLIIKDKNGSRSDDVVKAVKERLEKQKKAFNGYGTDQTAVLNKACIYTIGNYVCFLVSDNAKDWLRYFKKMIKVI